jgi:aquaporin Z
MILIKAVIAEFLGTFFFFSIILNAIANASLGPVAVAIGLLAAIYFGGSISGGHFNPAVSVIMFSKGKITGDVLVLYVIAQVLAGLVALGINSYFIS